MQPHLRIHTNTDAYSIGHKRLSQAKLWWLAHELSDFLNLPIHTTHPTPVIRWLSGSHQVVIR
ncbi:MAG: hypothetical protein AAFO84_01595 [Cyanobacteria bacterium J06598_1]